MSDPQWIAIVRRKATGKTRTQILAASQAAADWDRQVSRSDDDELLILSARVEAREWERIADVVTDSAPYEPATDPVVTQERATADELLAARKAEAVRRSVIQRREAEHREDIDEIRRSLTPEEVTRAAEIKERVRPETAMSVHDIALMLRLYQQPFPVPIDADTDPAVLARTMQPSQIRMRLEAARLAHREQSRDISPAERRRRAEAFRAWTLCADAVATHDGV